MPELVIKLPDEIVDEKLSSHGEQSFLFDNMLDEDRNIVVLFLKESICPCPFDDYCFSTPDDARDEAWRQNKRLGLSDDEIVRRIEFVMDREGPSLPECAPEEFEARLEEAEQRRRH